MRLRRWSDVVAFSLFAAAVLEIGGCTKADPGAGANRLDPAARVENKEGRGETEEAKHNFKGRDWCAEHGVPESQCAQCNDRLAVKFKEKGDWCKEHDRPESQCFICHPELKAKFAAAYKAKYGEDPPPVADETLKEEPGKEPRK